MGAFWLGIIGRAARDSISLAQSIIFVLVAIVGIAGSTWASAHARVTSGRVALIVLIALIVVRLPTSIYRRWKDEHTKRVIAECQLHSAGLLINKRREMI